MDGLRRPPYHYEELAVASRTNGLYNVYAVVAEFSVPRRSRGSDHVCNLLLVDPSTDGMQRPVEMLAFAPSAAQVPRVRKPGDIVRLHRVKVQYYNDKPQMIGKVAGRIGPPFAFCLFDSDLAAGEQPYQVSSGSFYWDEREAATLRALRHYVAASNVYHLVPKSDYIKTIKDVRPRTFVDMVAKVLGYGEVSVGDPSSWGVIFLWDGTDTLPLPHGCDMRTSEEEMVTPELQKRIDALQPLLLPLPGPHDPELPPLGSVLPLVVQGGRSLLGSTAPELGSWVKLRNIGIRVVNSQIQGYYSRVSKWAPWEEEGEAMRAYQHRLLHQEMAGWAPASPDQLLARSLHPDRPFSSIRQILQDTPCGVPRKYRVLARVMTYTPADPSRMCHTTEDCGLEGPSGANSSGALQCVYTLKLLLEDATGQLDAILFGPDATTFLGGLAPGDLAADREAARKLVDCLERLMGRGYQEEGGPWIDVCLKAYYSPDASHPWDNRQYMIFDTIMA